MEIEIRAAIFRSWGEFKAHQTGEDACDHPLMSDASQIKCAVDAYTGGPRSARPNRRPKPRLSA